MENQKDDLKEFLYIISHDFQEPLRHICAYSEMLSEVIDENNNEAQSCIQKIDSGCRKLKSMLYGLLQLSRIKKETLKASLVDFNSVFHSALKKVELHTEQNGTQVKGSLPVIAPVDENLLELFFIHLISNSFKFKIKGTQVVIDLKTMENDENWQLEYHDNGIGIEPIYHEKVFQLFQKLHSTSEYPGLGIGLNICKKIIEEHGGTIELDSESGKGSTFKISLPKKPLEI